MSKSVRVIVCPVDSDPYVVEVKDELECYQELVNGYIETVPFLGGSSNIILCDEQGKISGKPVNNHMTAIMHDTIGNMSDYLVGTCAVLSVDSDAEFQSVANEDATLRIIKMFYKAYSNLKELREYYAK